MRIKARARRSVRIYGFTPEGCRNSPGKSMARIDGHGVSIDTRTEAFRVNTEDARIARTAISKEMRSRLWSGRVHSWRNCCEIPSH
jgi:hypothetical protein